MDQQRSGMTLKSSTSGFAVALIIAAAYLFIALLVACLRPDLPWSLTNFVGSFLFAGFSFAAFCIPVYLASAATLLIGKRFRRRHVLILTATIIPFLTLSLLLKTVLAAPSGQVSRLLADILGRTGSATVLGFALIFEGLVFYRVIRRRAPVHSGIRLLRDNTGNRGFVPILDGVDFGTLPVSEEEAMPVMEEEAAPVSVLRVEPIIEAEDIIDEEEGPDLPALVPTSAMEPEEPRRALAVDAQFEYVENDEEDLAPKPAIVEERKPRKKLEYSVPTEGLLTDYPDGQYWIIDDETRASAEVLRETLQEFKIQAEVTGIRKGPVITMFEILPSPGVKLSKIVNLADNIALRLAASRVRIVAPIPGKHAVGIEVPNKHRAIVSFKEMIQDEIFREDTMEIPVALGKDITGEAQIIDLTKTPHLLIAGATGAGKSVCANAIISSILYTRHPSQVRLLLIDPKIVELKLYNDIPHLLTPVITEPKKAYQALQYCIYEMERRYSLLDALGVRDIRSYNRKVLTKKLATLPMPYIVVVVDEFADLMATVGKDLESTLARLAAMSRAVGIHLVLATQRPSVDVITGLIKANIPSRIAFMVAGKFDSRIIIDEVGAEKLLGRGDMLFTSAWDPVPVRIQGAFLSEEEVEQVTDFVRTLGKPNYIDDEIFIDDEDGEGFLSDGADDPLMSQALDIVVQAGKASASYLQRRLKIGYNRAAQLVEDMEERGIVGPQQGSKPREILHVPSKHGSL